MRAPPREHRRRAAHAVDAMQQLVTAAQVIESQLDSKLHEMVRLRDALPPFGVPVNVVVISVDEVSRRDRVPSTLVHRALREGRVLVA
jgi:hypothetical protein